MGHLILAAVIFCIVVIVWHFVRKLFHSKNMSDEDYEKYRDKK